MLLYINWDVSPEIFSIGPLSIRYYGVFFALGFLIGIMMLKRFYKIENQPLQEIDTIVMYVFLGAVLGARLGHVLFYEPGYYFQNPLEIIKIWHGGLASHGGAIGIVIALYIYSRKYKKNLLWLLDRISIPTALAGALIRLGNLMNSEIYGHPTNLPWGFVFVRNGETIPKHPTQIYEACFYVIIFVILLKMYNRVKNKNINGVIFSWFMILIFGVRFFIEFLKEVQVDFERTMLLNMGQILSLPFIFLGIILLLKSKKSLPDKKIY